MLRKSLAVPAAAVVLLSGAAGLGSQAQHTRAARTQDNNFSGTISITDYQVPSALGGGNAGSAQANQNLISAMSDSALTIDQNGNFLADLATEVPSLKNGGLKVVNGDEIITFHIKPNLKWSDGSPITHADWIIPYLIDFSPDYSNTNPLNLIKTASWSGNDFILHLKGVLGSALQQLLPGPDPAAYYQKKYGATLPASMLNSWDYAKETDAKTGLIPASTYASSNLKKLTNAWINDNYNSPNDLFSGPYKLESWSADQRYVLSANPYYTALPADPKHPRPAKLQWVVLSENGTTYVQDLKASSTYNSIDTAWNFTPDNIADLRQTKYTVVTRPQLGYELLDLMVGPTFNGQANPLHDVRIRQALNYSIDKNLYLKALFPGFDPKQLALASFLPAASSWSYNSHLPENAYNPAKAKSLLASAGYATSLGGGGKHLTLDFVTTTKSSRIKGAQLLQRFFNQVGITIKIRFAKATGTNGLFSPYQDGGIQDHHAFQISLHGFTENPDPDEAYLNFAPDQITSASNPNGANVDMINDPMIDKLFTAGRNSLDPATRQKIYNQAQQYYYDQAYNISLYTNPDITLVKGTIGNFKPTVTQLGNEWNAFEWWYDPTNSQKPLLQ